MIPGRENSTHHRLDAGPTQMMQPVGNTAWWNDYFAEGGGWERNGGRSQTRLFAAAFCQSVRLEYPRTFTLLDVGCALGEALRVFHKQYPNAELHGSDISQVAISRGRAELGTLAQLSVRSIEQLVQNFDVIYVSNVLEHFTDYKKKARSLAEHCQRLCIMVPFTEHHNGKPLMPDPTQHHQHTFERNSFDYLVREGVAKVVRSHVVSVPGAWGWTFQQKVKHQWKNPMRWLLGRPCAHEPLQVVFDIHVTRAEE
jgi:SAM-dependent methyltransferase